MGDLVISILFIVLGLYSALNYKTASKKAINIRTKNFKQVTGKEMKVNKKLVVLHEKFALVISLIFIVIGTVRLIDMLF